jgi:hypothetical protein
MLVHWGLCLCLLSAIGGCSTSPSGASPPANDGGLNLIVSPVTCPDAGTLRLADAGACVPETPQFHARDCAAVQQLRGRGLS